MIRFACPACEKRFRVPDDHAGKKGRCSSCKGIIRIPEWEPELEPFLPSSGLRLKEEPIDPPPPPAVAYPTPMETQTQEQPDPGTRRFPVLLDVFLFPTSTAGLVNLAVYGLVIPVILFVLGFILGFAPLGGILLLVLSVIAFAYMTHFLVMCVRDSMEGETRASDHFEDISGPWDVLTELLFIVITLLSLGLPALVLYLCLGSHPLFWISLSFPGVFAPIALLCTIYFDRFPLNSAFLWCMAILKAPLAYLGLLVVLSVFYVLVWVFHFLWAVVLGSLQIPMLWLLVFRLTSLYMAMVGAHILGRFYFRYEERFNW